MEHIVMGYTVFCRATGGGSALGVIGIAAGGNGGGAAFVDHAREQISLCLIAEAERHVVIRRCHLPHFLLCHGIIFSLPGDIACMFLSPKRMILYHIRCRIWLKNMGNIYKTFVLDIFLTQLLS